MRRSPQHIGRKGHQFLSQALRPRRIVLYVVFVLLGAVLSVVGIYGISALKLYTEANRFISASENLANTALGCGGGGNIGTSAREMVTSTRALRDELDKSQWTFLRDHTAYGNDITAARTMLDAMGNLVDGPFTDLMDLSKQLSGFSMKDKSVDLSAVTAMPGIVKQARADIKVETRRLEKLAPPKSSSIASMVKTGVSGLKSVDKMLNEYDELINLLPQLLGENGERTYLVAIYNPAELRSGGGMVGNIAPVTADHGKVTIGDFIATTDITYGTQPYDAENVKEAAVFGDQVWKYPQTTTVNPNFQRAAVTLKNMWLAQPGNENQEIAGVFALDPVFHEHGQVLPQRAVRGPPDLQGAERLHQQGVEDDHDPRVLGRGHVDAVADAQGAAADVRERPFQAVDGAGGGAGGARTDQGLRRERRGHDSRQCGTAEGRRLRDRGEAQQAQLVS